MQCLDQAIWIAEKHPVNIDQIKKWAKQEGEEDKFKIFVAKVKK